VLFHFGSAWGGLSFGLAIPTSEIFTGICRSLGPACPTLVPRIAGTVLSHFGPCRARPVGYCVLANFVSPKPPSPAPPLRVGFCARARTVSFVRPPPLLSFAAHRLLACDLHHWTRQSSASTGRPLAACTARSPASPALEIGPQASSPSPCPRRHPGRCAPRSAVGSPSSCARRYLSAPWRLRSADRPAGWATRRRSLRLAGGEPARRARP